MSVNIIFKILKKIDLKLGLIMLFLALGIAEFSRRIAMFFSDGFQPIAIIAFLILFTLCVISIAGSAYIRNIFIRWILAILFAVSSLIVDGYQWTIGDFMDYGNFITMAQSGGDLGEAIAQYGFYMGIALAKAAIIAIAIGIKPKNSNHMPLKLARYTAIPVILMLTILLYLRGGEGASGLPSSHNGLSFGLLYGYEKLTEDKRPREPVSLKTNGAETNGDIILIIDESVAGAYLDINSKNGVYSGLNNPKSQISVHNFGLAAAITNCSVGSNITMRFGGTRENYRETIKRKPSIWAYAKAANLETIYIDAQRTNGVYQNRMNDAERALIDQWIQYDDISVLQRDQHAADDLVGFLNDDKQQLIILNKVGAHFPVSDKFPDSHAQYRPMLKRENFDIADGPKDELDGRKSNWVLYRNSYRNTLLWNVGNFFDHIFANAKIGESLIIYTSDHGQTFHERGEYGEATHCTPNPQIEEGVIPLVAIGGSKMAQDIWAKSAKINHDKISGYRIFPTLLKSMGFAQDDVEKFYGPNLFSVKKDPYTFNIKFNARLGKNPIFQYIKSDKIVHPPIADHKK